MEKRRCIFYRRWLVHCCKTQVIEDQMNSDGMNIDEYCCFLKKEKEKHFENDKKQSINESENGLVPTSRPMMCGCVGHYLVYNLRRMKWLMT